ncbi:Pentatricopeptide repeat-containing protein [Ananas comosus]|uniref:Pentatricopeptide repeat-containing protein n=1 Tax=Ananas comosus TaxID=4615 RepID=A0A199VW54_ANACO|nr:Pentatricopeptide repeat-containing protein [Ananas comosus]
MHKFLLHLPINRRAVSKCYYATNQVVSKFATFPSLRRSRKLEGSGVDTALTILDLMIPQKVLQKVKDEVQESCHHRLIKACMQDILETQSRHSKINKQTTPSKSARQTTRLTPTKVHSSSAKEDAFFLFLELHERGISVDLSILCSVMSTCADTAAINTGVQLHTLLLKIGCDLSIPIGSSLISLYAKCGKLDEAYQVFQMLPTRNTISWTAIIAGFAQNGRVETCLYLFVLMRRSMTKPNDFTFASLLAVCTSSACLGIGRSFHGLEIKMGFDMYVHISNALISMYAKCGSIADAHYVFDEISRRDLISWNSMIFGYSQYGLAEQALNLLNEMIKENVKPDAISFLGVLSSCRHVGLVEEGRRCFSLMLDCDVKPDLDHYSCIVDLLGRAGLLNEALDLIARMPIPPNAVIWGSLLSSARVHGNVWVGIRAAESRLFLEPGCAATYVQLANLYASAGSWDQVANVRKLMKERGLKTSPGYSWIEVGNKVYIFKAEDRSNKQANEILAVLDCLQCQMDCPRDLSIFEQLQITG